MTKLPDTEREWHLDKEGAHSLLLCLYDPGGVRWTGKQFAIWLTKVESRIVAVSKRTGLGLTEEKRGTRISLKRDNCDIAVSIASLMVKTKRQRKSHGHDNLSRAKMRVQGRSLTQQLLQDKNPR